MSAFCYAGSELRLFEQARNWKSYWMEQMEPFIQGSVLEVGAGIGANTMQFATLPYQHWTCLEPDITLARQIPNPPGFRHETIVGVLTDLPEEQRFDTILYIDVLEHIEFDREELRLASERLNPNGTLIVLAPAHPFLYSEFDRKIGHYRRYTAHSLKALDPPGTELVRAGYIDSAGMLASLANRLILRSSTPTLQQIQIWDRVLVPLSRFLDPVFAGRIGKSVLGIWWKGHGSGERGENAALLTARSLL